MTKEYFFTTVEEKKKIRVVPVSGCGLDSTLKVACPTDIRGDKAGKILVASAVKLAASGKYYIARKLVEAVPGSPSYDNYLNLVNSMTKKSEPEKVGTDDKTKEKVTTTLLETIVKDTKLVAPKSKTDGYYISDSDWALLVRNIKKHINTMIIGPTGSGKTSCIKEVCDRMGIKLHVFDMGSMIDPISSLLGVHRLEGGESVFDYAKFTQCIQEPCVILLDELNRASLACNNVLFPCLDDRRSLSIEIASGKGVREIKVHPDVTFIATANVGQEYTGTNSMDRALVNRFFPLELRYLPENEEIDILIKRTGITKDQASGIVKVAKNIRSLYDKQEISVSVSIRETLMVAGLIGDGWDIGKSMETIFLPLYEGTKNEGERSTIYKTISSY